VRIKSVPVTPGRRARLFTLTAGLCVSAVLLGSIRPGAAQTATAGFSDSLDLALAAQGGPAAATPAGGSANLAAALGGPGAFDTASRTSSDLDLDLVFGGAPGDPAASRDTPLFLAVTINGRDTGLVGAFVQEAGTGRLRADRAELRDLGLIPPPGTGPAYLDALPGVRIRYDLLSQTVLVTAEDAALVPRRLSTRPAPAFVPPETGFGAILNYRLDATVDRDLPGGDAGGGQDRADATLFLEGRVHTPLGVLSTTGTIRSDADAGSGGGAAWQRLDTSLSHAAPDRMLTFTLGDFVGAGVGWSRPLRMGGLQVRRDFSLRSDIVTVPLLSYAGSAAVPSSVDVFVDQVRAYSGQIAPGPFVLTDLPYVTGSGAALIVIRDEAGRSRQVEVPFFAPRNLLRAGVLDFALQVGLPRDGYGGGALRYGDAAAAAGSLRYGLTDRVTLEGHLEGDADLVMAGFGLGAVVFEAAEIGLAAAASDHAGRSGSFAEATLRTGLGRAEISLSSMRRFGDFADLAYAADLAFLGGDPFDPALDDLRAAAGRDVLSIGTPVFKRSGSLGLSLIREDRGDSTNRIASLSYVQRIGEGGPSLRLGAFGTSGGSEEFGVSAGLSMRLGENRYLSGGLSRTPGGRNQATARLARPIDSGVGSSGYAASLTATDTGRSGDLRLIRNTSYGTGDLLLQENAGRATAQLSFAGGLVMAGGGAFAGPTVRGAFAVVDAGLPGVGISLENRPVARTGASGRALVTGLRPNSRNRISLDTRDLPLDFGIAATASDVVPARDAGVVLRFGGTTGTSALVVLTLPDGSHVPPGSRARLQGAGDEAVVGYDGLVWLTGLKPRNRLTVRAGDTTCLAAFAFRPAPGEQVVIDPVECAP